MRRRRAAHPRSLTRAIDNAIYDRAEWRADASPLSLLGGGMTAARFGYLRDLLEGRCKRRLEGMRVRDIGCGGGYIAEELARAGADVVGVDPSRASLAAARAHAREAGLQIDYREGAGERLPAGDGEFELACCCDVLEHVDDLDAVMAEAARVLARGGVYFFDTINRTAVSRLVAIKLVQEWRATRIVDFPLHEFARFVTPDELAGALRRHGLAPGEMVGLVPRSVFAAVRVLMARRLARISYGEVARRLELVPGRSLALAYMGHAIKT